MRIHVDSPRDAPRLRLVGRLSARDAARIAVVLAVLFALASFATAADREAPLVVGDRAPSLELGDQHGQPFRLADALAANRFVVLAFYPKAFTGG